MTGRGNIYVVMGTGPIQFVALVDRKREYNDILEREPHWREGVPIGEVESFTRKAVVGDCDKVLGIDRT